MFFRDDDVGEWTDPLRVFVDVLIEHAIPCHYQVVPDYLDAACAGELRRLKEAHPSLVHFNQHGLHHEQMLNGVPDFGEFAGGRAYDDQYRDIAEGRSILGDRLGEAFEGDVFTPPCHKYDAQTIRVLGDLGFEILSAGVRGDPMSRAYYAIGRALRRVDFLGKRVSYHCRSTPDARISEVSAALDVHVDKTADGRMIEKSADALWEEFAGLRGQLDVVGIMGHHQSCETPEKQKAFREFVSRLVGDPTVQIVGLLDLAPNRRRA